MKVKLPYALNNNQLVHIDDIKGSGIQEDCFCPSCGAVLIARKGTKKVHHFAHYKTMECEHALESALHLAAKEILSKEKKFRIPAYAKEINEEDVFNEDVEVFIDLPSSLTLIKEETFVVDDVILEKRTDNIIPDIVLEIKGQKVIVEIAVTHFIDEVKLEKIKQLGISTIEIDLSKSDRTINNEILKEEIIIGTENKKWIYNRAAERRYNAERTKFISDNRYEAIHEERKREELLSKNTKEIRVKEEKVYKRIKGRGLIGVTQKTEYVSPCPIKRKEYKGEYIAEVKMHCIACLHFNGFFNARKSICCLGEYHINKQSSQT